MTTLNKDNLTIAGTRPLLQRGDISVRELVELYLEEIRQRDDGLHAYLEVFADDAREYAAAEDRRIKSGGALRPLSGVPIAIKDNIVMKGKHATAGSRILSGFQSPYDATVIVKLREAGALLFGRTNMDEFAMGSSTEHSAYGLTRNPHDHSRVPGGSSGGSAVAVAAGMAMAALGSDTGGSIRQPAAFCGTVGLLPTYGSVSRFGLIAMASSLDQIGPITRTVRDAGMLFDVIRGKDPRDATSRTDSHPMLKRIRVGIPKEFFSGGKNNIAIDEDVRTVVGRARETLKDCGYDIADVSLPSIPYALSSYYIIMPAEVSANLARYDGVRYGLKKSGKTLAEDYIATRDAGFGREVKRRILLGSFVLSSGFYDAYYGHATGVRHAIRKEFRSVFSEVDLLLAPTTPTPAFRIGEKSDPVTMYLSDVLTVPANLAGVPAISLPFGTVERDGHALPVGVQLIAPWFGEALLLKVGEELESRR